MLSPNTVGQVTPSFYYRLLQKEELFILHRNTLNRNLVDIRRKEKAREALINYPTENQPYDESTG